MKILELQQNSEEWLEFRKGKSGGSEFGNIWSASLPTKTAIIEKLESDGQKLTPADKRSSASELASMLEPSELAELKLSADPKERYYEMVAELVARPLTPNDYAEELNGQPFSAMARGHILEPKALEAFEQKTGKQLDKTSVVWISDYDDNAYISPDGTITSDDGKIREAVEVKCLASPKVVKAFLTGKYPEEYFPQVLKYFMVNDDLEKLYFVIYTDLIPGLDLQIFEIKRNEVADKIAEAVEFEKKILSRISKDAEKIMELGF